MLRFVAVGRCDLHGTVIFDLDGSTGLFGQGTDNRTAFTDNVFDLVRVDLDGVDYAVRIQRYRRAAR